LPLNPVRAPEVKFSGIPDRLLDSIIDDALAAGVARMSCEFNSGLEARTDLPSI